MVQRLLAASSERASRAYALLGSWVIVAAQFTLFLVIGVCLFTLYSDRNWATPSVTMTVFIRRLFGLTFPREPRVLVAGGDSGRGHVKSFRSRAERARINNSHGLSPPAHQRYSKE